MIQHLQGYRAEYARPLKLCATPAQSRERESRMLIDAVAHRFAITVVADADDLTRR